MDIMSDLEKFVFVEVIQGVEGLSLSIGNHDIGLRLAGPKPWGGGKIIHQFKVDHAELIAAAKSYAFKENK